MNDKEMIEIRKIMCMRKLLNAKCERRGNKINDPPFHPNTFFIIVSNVQI